MDRAPRTAREQEEDVVRYLIFLCVLAACAQQGFPPGGPPDKLPPKLLSTSPDSNERNVSVKEVNLQYDEVLNERPAGAGGLDALVLISPRDGAPRVGWHRTRLSIHGRKDWRPNTTYTVIVLPGISDLRGNASKQEIELVFSTGPEIAGASISGVVFDWPAGHPAPRALVKAVAHPDSVVYVSSADSLGHFRIAHLPPGTFTVYGWVDANNNRDLDIHELWDSTHVVLADTARTELLSFIHDSIGPHVVTVEVRDSVTLHASFDKPVDPKQPLDTAHFTLRAADSSVVRLRSVVSAREVDKRRADSLARADSVRAITDTAFRRQYLSQRRVPADSAARSAARLAATLASLAPSKPVPVTDLLITLYAPLKAGALYRLEARDLHNLMGIAAGSIRSFSVPKPAPPPPPGSKGAPGAVPAPTTKPDTTRPHRPPT
jgi:hypothetical protein